MLDNGSDIPQKKLIIICSSYFDRLGHPIFANKIQAELASRFEDGIEIRGIATSSDDFVLGSSSAVPVPVVCGSRYTIDARSAMNRRYGGFSLLIIWCVRFISVTHFYWRTFRTLDRSVRVIDLECEPIQAAFAAVFALLHSDLRISFVIHSMPGSSKSSLIRAYKRLSVTAIQALLRVPSRRAIFMNSTALESAVNKGVPRDRCVLGGWGYDMRARDNAPVDRPTGDRTVVLAFGVLRKDKRIAQLVNLFLELDDPSLMLRVVGKSLDVDVSQLRQRIADCASQTIVEISDDYVAEDKIAGLFVDSHIVVLSHSAGFESMSGPMFLAIQYDRPILCFSGHTVANLVQESGAGIVLQLEDDRNVIRAAITRLRNWRYDQESLRRFTWSAIADRMVDW